MSFADDTHIWTINPEFLRDDGSSFALDEPIPQSVRANMYVLYPESRLLVRNIAYVGRQVRMVEGSRAVALGEITAIKNLPNDLSEYERVASAFAIPARAYVRWFNETKANDAKSADMRQLHELLARLQAAAALLPGVEPTGEDPRRVHHEVAAAAASIALKLPVKNYSFIFDPLNEKERDPVVTTLQDDLEDIYKEMSNGFKLYDAGGYRDALWTWHFTYYSHWGRHLGHAQTAVWQFLANGNW